jgi:hypothetical protein
MTNNKQQLAVEWLFSETLGITLQLANKRISHRNWELQMVKLYEQAKEMQKELMKGMYVEGSFAKMRYYDGLEYIDAEQYYNETYGGGEQ